MQRYKGLAFRISRASGLRRLTRVLKRGAVALAYHGITQEILDPRVQSIHLPFPRFEEQIQYILRNYSVVSIDDLNDCLSHGHKVGHSQVLLTFDDGYKGILKWVAPFLKYHDLPFVVFVSTKHVEGGLRFPTYRLRASLFYSEKPEVHIPGLAKTFVLTTPESRAAAEWELRSYIKFAPASEVSRVVEELENLLSEQRWQEIDERFSSDEPMDWEDLREIVRLGGVVGSHSHDHFIFHARQSAQDAEEQLTISRGLIAENLGQCQYLAYPEGDPRQIPSAALGILRKSGYRLAFCSQEGEITRESNVFLLPRFGAPEDLDHFAFRVDNSFLYERRYRESTQNPIREFSS